MNLIGVSEVNIENEQEAIFQERMHESFLFLMKDFRISESQGYSVNHRVN